MERITQKQLEMLVDQINAATESPPEPYRVEDGRHKANIGNYHLSGAYGGWALHRMDSDGGGVDDVFGSGHVPRRELYQRMRAFLVGLRAKS